MNLIVLELKYYQGNGQTGKQENIYMYILNKSSI